MKQSIDKRIPRRPELIRATFLALKKLGGSGKNDEIVDQIISDLQIPNKVADIPHKGNPNKTELSYQADWARTYLRIYGAIVNSARSVWSICPAFTKEEDIDGKVVNDFVVKHNIANKNKAKNGNNEVPEYPEESQPWKEKLAAILQNMDPYGFERLSQRVLRECGFTQVEVTKKSGDGGIDGTGKLRINGIFSFNVAFQCKRYKGLVGAGEVRDFRGSLTTDIEKGVMITTGTFSKAAKEEASNPGKQQIDLIDGEEFISKIAEYGLGVKEIKTFEVEEDFFKKI
jgi:restriction system protein